MRGAVFTFDMRAWKQDRKTKVHVGFWPRTNTRGEMGRRIFEEATSVRFPDVWDGWPRVDAQDAPASGLSVHGR
jgi:hypothetical protein